MFVIFFISALAETNRPPFDLPEAEAELVAGYQTEYSGMMYAMFWLGEYANILLMCAMGAILFLGGWLSNRILRNDVCNVLVRRIRKYIIDVCIRINFIFRRLAFSY